MIVRLVADIQNRLFWPSPLVVLVRCVPSAGSSQVPEMGYVPAEQRLRGFEPRCCGQGGLDRGDFPKPAQGADVRFESSKA